MKGWEGGRGWDGGREGEEGRGRVGEILKWGVGHKRR